MNSSSFENHKPSLDITLKTSLKALLRYVILAQSTPISLHTKGFVPFVSLSTLPELYGRILKWLKKSKDVNLPKETNWSMSSHS